MEQERQLSVLQHEKARVAGLLSKKDTLARELQKIQSVLDSVIIFRKFISFIKYEQFA